MKTILKSRLFFLLLLAYKDLFAQAIQVPIDYHHPEMGTFPLEYEYGDTFQVERPTIIVIADAQQFYVRKGRVKKIQADLFGDRFNVLGIIPRASNQELLKEFHSDAIDWDLGYCIFQSFQYVQDIHSVVNKVLESQAEVYLYGQSGGALLITEYLSTFPDTKVKKVFIGASLNPSIEYKLGINHDNFQRDFLTKNPEAQAKLNGILDKGFFHRDLVEHLFQRQHFFVTRAQLESARRELMDHLFERDTAYVNQLREAYQIQAIQALMKSNIAIPIRVRLAEFIYPMLPYLSSDNQAFYPDLEHSYDSARPVLMKKDQPPRLIKNSFQEKNFRNYAGKVFILSARYDHVADYRASIYLQGLLSNSTLFLVDDDHTFKRLKSEQAYAKLIQHFFGEKEEAGLSDFEKYTWYER